MHTYTHAQTLSHTHTHAHTHKHTHANRHTCKHTRLCKQHDTYIETTFRPLFICTIHCSTLQLTATYMYNTLQQTMETNRRPCVDMYRPQQHSATHCNTMQKHAATHHTIRRQKMETNRRPWVHIYHHCTFCNTLQHTAPHYGEQRQASCSHV